MCKKIFSVILIFSHLAVFGPIRDAFAFSAQSASYAIASGTLAHGGRGGISSYINTKLLLHAEGAAGALSLEDELGNAVGVLGNARIDTSQSKFGSSSVLFDGLGDYLSLADSPDWAFGTGNFTVDFWVRFNDYTKTCGFLEQYENVNNFWFINKDSNASGNKIAISFRSGGVGKCSYTMMNPWSSIANNTWYHIAVVRNGPSMLLFIDGVSQALAEVVGVGSGDVGDIQASLYVGYSPFAYQYLNGWIDELRISKGIARWTSNFTVPQTPHGFDQTTSAFPSNLIDSIGEACIGKATSLSFILESGFIPTIKSNPPVQSQLIPNQNWQENASKPNAFDLDDYFISPDGSSLTYSVSGNTNIMVSIDPASHIVSLAQPQAWFGTEKIKFTATDSEHNTKTSNEVTLQVQGVDNAPVLDFIPDVVVNENELISITPHATDLDNDTITFSFTAPLNGAGQWQTDYNSAGIYTVTVTATDSTSLISSQQVHINVRNVNRPPVLNPISDITANEGDIITITPIASDPDNDAVIFYYSSPFDATGKWLTGYSDAGTRTATVTASDGTDTVSRTVNIIVNNTNRAPEATLTLSKYTASPNEAITVTLAASDPDSDPMTYSIKKDGLQVASGAISSSTSVTTSFSSIGDHTITATVTDSGGLSATITKGVDIVDPNVNQNAINPVMGDFNGDALIDLGLHNSDTGVWEVAISQGGVFTNAVDWLTGFGATRDWAPIGGDFNGDGKTDVGIYNSATGEFKPALSSGSGFTAQSTWLTFSGASSSWQIFTGNFNADKYTDLGFYNRETGEVRIALGNGTGFNPVSTWLNNSDTGYAAMSGDFNADGLSDLCLFKKTSGEFKVIFSNSKTFVDGGIWLTGFATDRDPFLSDFNHDGLTDIGYWEQSSSSWYYAISNGSQFVNKGAWLTNFGATSDDSATTGDFNGDGVMDRALFDREAQGINRWKVELNTYKPPDLLTEIDNGIGGKTSIVYTYSSKFDNELLPFPVYVTSSISLIDTLPAAQSQETYTQNFTYYGGYYDSVEREFRGFAKVKVLDPITSNYTETYFYQGSSGQDGALKGQIEKILAYDGTGRQISQTVNTYEVRKAGPQDNVLGFPALTQVETTVFEENASSITTKSRITYDNIGNPIEAFDDGDTLKTGDEKSTSTTYSAAYDVGFNRPLEVLLKDKDLNIVSKKTFEYDSKGNLSGENVFIFNSLTGQTNNSLTNYSYDSFGNLISTTDALGRAVTTEYETTFYAYPQRVTNALGHSVSYVYDPKFGVVTSVTDPNGQTSTTIYDTFGRVIEAKNSNNQVVSNYNYPDFNTKISTNALGLSKTEYADGLGRKYKSVSSGEDGAAARAVSSEVYYNSRGLVEKESIAHYIDEDPSQISYIRTEYDLRGRPKRTISDFPGTLKDAESQVNYINPLYVETIDPQGHKKGTLKDVYGNIIEVTEFTSGGVYKTSYEYDIQNNLTKTIDSKGNSTQIWYDSIGRKLKMNDPDMGIWTYEYDTLGNLIRQTDAKNQVLEFTYDSLNRLTTKLAGGQTLVTYLYDDATKQNYIGRLSKVTDQSGSTEFFYDNLGREIKSTKIVSGTPYTVERTYDILDRLLTLKYPDGEVVNYSYDSNSGALEKVNSASSNYVNDISYNAKGQIKAISYGNGTQTNYTYGQDLRLSRILTSNSALNLQDLNYIFDKNGNITTLTDNLRSNIRTYTYDELDRLTQANNVPSPSGGYTNYNYQYDSIGNMTYKSDIGVMTYGSGAGPHAVTSAGGYSYTYDANGNMTTGKNKAFVYDSENRIISIDKSGSVTSFVYDGDGGRVKQITPGDSTTYIGSLFEIDSGGKATKHIFAGSNKVCSVESTGNKYYTHSDHLGSSSVVTNSSGQQIVHYEYTPYGSLAVQEPSTENRVSSYLFTGKELDSTGLYFYGARYYDPEIGRFVTADTIVQAPYDPQSLNRYTYCRNNPLNYVDPSGHWSWKKFWHSLVGAVLGVALAVVLGPAGVGMSMTMAGMWGGMAGGALTGGLEGGWQGALMGGLIGGIAGGVAGWAVEGEHTLVLGGMFAASAGLAGATDSWDSFVGGLTGGLAGWGVGSGITSAYKERFANFRAGDGFRTNRGVLIYKYEREIKMIKALCTDSKDKTIVYGVRGLAKNKSLDPATIGPKHSYTNDGSPWEMGPVKGKIQTSNTVEDLSSWDTHITTQKAIASGLARETTVQVNSWGWEQTGIVYEKYWVGQPYISTNHNSNYATATRIYGSNGEVPDDLGWAPQFK